MKTCLLTFDVEEWFQVENLRSAIPQNKWNDITSTVSGNTDRILDLLQKYDIKATFFILGDIAEKHPNLVKRIYHEGHEVASHGYGHQMSSELDKDSLYLDVQKSKEILEQIIEDKIFGYRAPNFSINDSVIDILIDLGFNYDSSYNQFQIHGRYGSLNKYSISEDGIYKLTNSFYEIPVSAVDVLYNKVPIGGGAYFRIFPFFLFKNLAYRKLKQDGIFNFYLHPWEFEPDQPKIHNISLNHKFRHYTGLSRVVPRLIKLIEYLTLKECRFVTMSELVQNMTKK